MTDFNNIVAICGSSRSGYPDDKSLTRRMVDHFLEGLKPKQQRIFYPHLMKIMYCRGCYDCWFKTPGICSVKDDMHEIRADMDQADLVILASPLYVDGFSAQTKIVLDRLICTLDPLISLDQEGHCRHKLLRSKEQTAVLISCCGFAEADNFQPLYNHFQAICRNLCWKNGGAALLPASGLAFVPEKYDEKFTAIREAGAELSREGVISQKTADSISREMLTAREYQDFLNPYFAKLKERQ